MLVVTKNDTHLTSGVFNTEDDSHEFLDKVQLSTLGIQHITIYITHTLEGLDFYLLVKR